VDKGMLKRDMLSLVFNEISPVMPNPVITPIIDGNTYLTSHLTIGELPGFDICVPPEMPVKVVAEYFEKQPGLPGVIIVEDGHCLAMLSRGVILERLSRPFGTELFLNKPISYMIRNVQNTIYFLPSTKRIDEAVQMALSRPSKDMYEPFVVQYEDRHYRLLDFYVLILAQAQLLANANYHIEKQVQTGRTLSNILDVEEVITHILADLAEIIPYDHASIGLVRDGKIITVFETSGSKYLGDETWQDVIKNEEVHQYIIQSQGPILINNNSDQDERKSFRTSKNVQSWLAYPLMYSNKISGIISLTRFCQQPGSNPFIRLTQTSKMNFDFSENDLELLSSMEPTYAVAIRNAQLHCELEHLAITDSLTEINNRRGFFKIVTQEMDHLIPLGQNIAVLMVDIDLFKRVNDYFGHTTGDLVIRKIAEECRVRLRDNDIIGRYGGEEFVIFLPGSDLEAARSVADRLRHQIAQLRIETERGALSVTVSIGVAHYFDGLTLDTLLQHADEALYRAKGQGRNRVEIWQPKGLPVIPAGDYQSRYFIPKALETCKPNSLNQSGILKSWKEEKNTPDHEKLFDEMINGWVRLLELKDKETEGHATRVAQMTMQLAREVGVDGYELKNVYYGALLHDIGKIGIPDEILFKPSKLTDNEWKVMRKHPDYAYQILSPIADLSSILSIPLCHHEKWDGSGYPRGIKRKEIPIEARLFAMVDVWDALSSDRVYRPAWEEEQICRYFLDQSGIHFDPDLVPIFLNFISKGKEL
jgi:diguanylate cyclase (GGDEF)-like protein